MALEYFLYTTEYNNTLVDRSDTSFSPLPPYGEIHIDFLIPNTQPLYYYRETGSTIVLNDEATINAYLEGIAPPPEEGDSVDYGVYTGYTASTQQAFTGYTATTDITIADKVRWANVWTGGTYQANDMVYDDSWTMIANKETADFAAPQRVGDERYLYYPLDPSGVSTNAKQIVFGMQYSGGTGYWLNGYRVNVVSGNHYEIILIQDPDGANQTTFLNSFTASITGWREFGLIPKPVPSGTSYRILAILNEPDPTPLTWVSNYNYSKPNNWSAPVLGEIVHANKDLNTLSINVMDNDSNNRTVLLGQLNIGDIITLPLGKRWAIQSVTDSTFGYFNIDVAPATQSSQSGVIEFTFETTVATTLSYGEDIDFWSGRTDIQGLLAIDDSYTNVTASTNQYGVDILVQDAYLSPDWDFVTVQGNGGSSSGTIGQSVWGFIDGDIKNQTDLQTQFDTKVYTSGDTMTGSLSTSGNLTAVGAVTGSSISASVLITTPVLNASTSISAPQITGTTCIMTPISCASTRMQAPVVCASTCVISPITIGGSCLCSQGTTTLDGGVTAASFLNVSGDTTLGSQLYALNINTGGTFNDYTVGWNPLTGEFRTIPTGTGGTTCIYCYADNRVTQNNATTTNTDYLNESWTLSEGYYESEFNAVFGNTSANRCAEVSFLVNGVVVGSCNLMKTNAGVVRTTAYITQNGNLSGGTHIVQIVFREIGGGISQVHYGSMRVQRIGETV